MSADRLPLLVAYGEDDSYEKEEAMADDFELRAMVDGHVLVHGKSARRPSTGMTGQAGEESSTPSTPGTPAPRCLPTARGLGYLLSGAVLACMFIFFGLVVGVDSTMRAGKVVIFLLSVSDALIALSYFFIPGAMFAVVLMRKDIAPYVWIVWMFGAFIVCCGLTHAISAIRPWAFSEWVMVAMKIVTAAVSYATAIAVYRIIPLAMLIPSPIQLELEINERKAAQGKLQSRYERSVVTNQVTRDIRRNLQLSAICRATAEHCAELFNADECTLYQHKRKSPKPAPAPEEQPTDERDSQCQGADCEAQPCREDAASTTPQEVKDHRYSVLSEHTKHLGRAQEEDGALGSTGEVEPVGTRQRRHSALKRNLQRRAPPLHLLPGFLCQHRAVVIDVAQGLALTHRDGGTETDVVDEELLNYFRERDVAWVMCIALPYHATSCAAIVLHVKNKPAGTPSIDRCHWWSPEDIEQLEEISAQVEIGLAHAQLLQEAERGRQLTNLNLALTQAKAEAEAGSKAKSQFLAVVSHEIRTPMNAICGMTKVLKDSHMSSEQRECVQIISSSAKALLSLLNNILDFSKIEAGKTEIENTPFDIRACIQNIMGLMANYAGGKHDRVTLSTLTDSRVPYKVVGDKQHLRQVLINLLSNALKFTQVGSVTLRTSLNSAWTDPVTHESMADIRFEVTDTGIGIPQEKLDRLFHPFSQVDSGFTRKYEGTGLGLAISRRLCGMMGGSMWVQSQEHKGSTFGFNVRMRVEQMDGAEPTTGSEPESDDAWSSDTFTPPTQGRWEPASSSSSSSSSTSSSTSTSSFTSPSFSPSFSAPASPLLRPLEAPQTSVSADAIAPPARYRRRVYTTLSRSVPAHIRPVSPLPSPYLHHRASLAGDERISASLYQPKTLGTVPMTSPLRLLLAEDNLVNQKVAFKLLSRLGYYNVVTVANGRQAVESITAERAKSDGQPFDVVLMDLHMPEMDGITASRTVKLELRDQAPYIIACTADLQYDTRTACAQAGIDNYLEKPIKLKDLAKVLAAAATHRRRQGAADRTGL